MLGKVQPGMSVEVTVLQADLQILHGHTNRHEILVLRVRAIDRSLYTREIALLFVQYLVLGSSRIFESDHFYVWRLTAAIESADKLRFALCNAPSGGTAPLRG